MPPASKKTGISASQLPRRWWDTLIAKCIEEKGIIRSGLTPVYLSGAFATLTNHTQQDTLLRTTLDHLLDTPADTVVPYFYRCGGDEGPVIIKPVKASYLKTMYVGVIHPPGQVDAPNAVIRDDVWAAGGKTIESLKDYLVSQYNDPVLKGLYSLKFIKKTDEWVKFGTKDKRAIEAAHSSILAALPAAT